MPCPSAPKILELTIDLVKRPVSETYLPSSISSLLKVLMTLSTSKSFEEKVQLHFTQGIFALASLARCLLRAQKDPKVFAELREHITRASKELEEAEALTEQELERVNLRSLEIMALKNKLTDEQKRRKEDLDACNIRLQEMVTLRETNMRHFLEEKNWKTYNQVEQGLAEIKGETHRFVRNMALVSMLVPGLGPYYGECICGSTKTS